MLLVDWGGRCGGLGLVVRHAPEGSPEGARGPKHWHATYCSGPKEASEVVLPPVGVVIDGNR